MRHIFWATATALVVITSAANAEFGGAGAGTLSCGKFAKDYQLSPDLIEKYYFTWAQSYLSGVNAIAIVKKDRTDRDLSSIPVKQQEQFLRDYCNAHPLADYMEGVVALYLKFKLSAQ